MGYVLAVLFVCIAVHNIRVLLFRPGGIKGGYPVPFIGGLAGLGACLLLRFPAVHGWWWVPLAADPGTAYLTVSAILFAIQKTTLDDLN
jgi:hypothetical protein